MAADPSRLPAPGGLAVLIAFEVDAHRAGVVCEEGRGECRPDDGHRRVDAVRPATRLRRELLGQDYVPEKELDDQIRTAAITYDPDYDVPSRLEHASLVLRTSDPDRAIEVLATLGYRLQDPLSPGAWRAHRRSGRGTRRRKIHLPPSTPGQDRR